MVSLNLCKEYVNMATFKISILLMTNTDEYMGNPFIRHRMQNL